MRRAYTVAVILAMTALAGCTDEPAAIEADDPTLDALGLEASDDTGVIRGVVVDAAIRPIIGVEVTTTVGGEPAAATTNEDGAFGFSDLPPGSYTLVASKLGYFDTQTTTTVVAGEARPDAVKMQLDIDAATTPYVTPQTYTGFIECTTSALVLCGAPNLLSDLTCEFYEICPGAVTNDRYTPTLYFDHNATLIQTEMVWESSQSLSPELLLQQEALDTGCEGNRTLLLNADGPSPVLAPVWGDVLAEGDIGGDACGIYYSVFSGGVAETPPVPGVIGSVGVGATVQQDLQLLIHAFYHFTPPEGWRFTADGDPVVPA